MTISNLILRFATRYHVGVDIDDVVAEMRSLGVRDEIYYFWDAERNPTILRGDIVRWTYPSGSGQDVPCVDITYGRMGNDYERLVCCKELLHILEPDYAKVRTYPQIESLIEKIVLPPGFSNPLDEGIHALTDQIAIYQALAVLFPMNARSVLIEAYRHGTISLGRVADLVELPEPFVAVVMAETWEEVYRRLVALPI